jgi:hypothetical protein
MRLYELTEEFERLVDMLESGDESPELTAALEVISTQLEAKAAGVGAVLASLDAEADAYTAEIARLTAKKKCAQTSSDSLRRYVKSSMETRGILRIKGGSWSFAIQRNPESVEVTDESLVPDEVKRTVTTTTVDKRLVLELYKAHGEAAPGTAIRQTTRLVIR